MTELLPCPFCGEGAHFLRIGPGPGVRLKTPPAFWKVFCEGCNVRSISYRSRPVAAAAWNRRAPVTAPAAAKPSTCCPGEHLVPMHSTDTKLCTGCKTEKHWPLEPGQKRTY